MSADYWEKFFFYIFIYDYVAKLRLIKVVPFKSAKFMIADIYFHHFSNFKRITCLIFFHKFRII